MVYKFIGDGLGIPGLPHVISNEYAEMMGVADLLKTAIDAGLYVEQENRPSTSLRTDELKTDALRTKKEKEVKNGQ